MPKHKRGTGFNANKIDYNSPNDAIRLLRCIRVLVVEENRDVHLRASPTTGKSFTRAMCYAMHTSPNASNVQRIQNLIDNFDLRPLIYDIANVDVDSLSIETLVQRGLENNNRKKQKSANDASAKDEPNAAEEDENTEF